MAKGRDAGWTPRRPRPEVEVEVDERIEAALDPDAERQGVSPAELAGHAVLVYLAELDLIGDPEQGRPRRPASLVGPFRRPTRRRALALAPRSSSYFVRLRTPVESSGPTAPVVRGDDRSLR